MTRGVPRCTFATVPRTTDTVTVRLPKELAECIEDEAERQGLTRNAVIVAVLKRQYQEKGRCVNSGHHAQA